MVSDIDSILLKQLNNTVSSTHLPYPKYEGKVRDLYTLSDHLLIVATDRLSAFDRAITTIPFKGQVLSELSAWWFDKTQHIIPNHLLKQVNPNTLAVKKCHVFPIEVVVRQYLTGSTNTAIWTLYKQGQRDFFGSHLPDGLCKNTRLACPILTPTTKESTHDQPLTQQMIKAGNWIDPPAWEYIKNKALELFQFGQERAKEANLILVDTKYEFGQDASGNILLVDEIHTPDSSRFWEKPKEDAMDPEGGEPKGFDKEAIRLWLCEHSNPYKDKTLPVIPDTLKVSLAKSYISLYERITKKNFNLSHSRNPQHLNLT